MPDYIYNPNTGELYHYGVKGMKWGVRKAKTDYRQKKRAALDQYSNKVGDHEANMERRREALIKKHGASSDAYFMNGKVRDTGLRGKAKKEFVKEYKKMEVDNDRGYQEIDYEYKAAKKKAKEEYRQDRLDYKKKTTLETGQKVAAVGATVAGGMLAGPIGMLVVGVSAERAMRSSNYARRYENGKATAEEILRNM